jgi:hypothetical protein
VIEIKQSVPIGRYIYCGTTEGKLSKEHVTPFGLRWQADTLGRQLQALPGHHVAVQRLLRRNMLFTEFPVFLQCETLEET